MRRRLWLCASAALLAACSRPERARESLVEASSERAPRLEETFWKTWGDGQAEMNGYSLTYPRYGQRREGSAVAIFVTETFSNRLRVKADPGRHPDSDQFPVMKLNLVKDFQTGVYDYNTMLSAFVGLAPVNERPAGAAVKLSYSSQEWCGQVYQQLLFDAAKIRSMQHSYFDGEADRQADLDYPAAGLSEDALLLWARGMAGPVLQPGESRSVPFLISLETARLKHVPLVWTRATLGRSAGTTQVATPAGRFEAATFTARLAGGRTIIVRVEAPPPHRIVGWETSDGEEAQLLGSARMKYWQMNQVGAEDSLRKLGLKRAAPAGR
ncbi:MAG: hypothetical protein HYZ57_10535 [Acidobacteria bacterium]|nr:hypothetical protein [Acidobacteriota bacterium]MBI3280265.1 hypothetical protein [Acidobacteriota bacterium]